MYFGLFQNDCRPSWHIIAQNEYWKNLRHTEAHVGKMNLFRVTILLNQHVEDRIPTLNFLNSKTMHKPQVLKPFRHVLLKSMIVVIYSDITLHFGSQHGFDRKLSEPPYIGGPRTFPNVSSFRMGTYRANIIGALHAFFEI